MKHLIEATGNLGKGKDYADVEIPVEINIDGERENTAIIIGLDNDRDWWIPISELDHLMAIIDISFPKE